MVPLIAFRCNYVAYYFSLGITPITDGTSTHLEHYEAISRKMTRGKGFAVFANGITKI